MLASSGVSALPIVMYGAATCEDTAITRSRLVAIGLPFRELDVDLDAEAAREQRAANDGRRVTPTLVFGAGQLVVIEPTLEQLGEALVAAGHIVEPPEAIAYHDELASRPIPLRHVQGLHGPCEQRRAPVRDQERHDGPHRDAQRIGAHEAPDMNGQAGDTISRSAIAEVREVGHWRATQVLAARRWRVVTFR